VNPSSKNRPAWKALLAIPLLLAAASWIEMRVDAAMRPEGALEEDLVFRSGPLLKKLSLGYDALLGDIYWTRAVQYYGSRVGMRNANFDLLAPLLDITTTLDPRLIVAYRFGAIFLSEPQPMGAGRSHLAVDLVKRGIAANPNQWRLYYDLGFLYYWRLKDYPNAAAAYLAGSKVPNAPLIMKLMAARIAQKGGSIETSRMIFAELYESTNDPNVRKAALKQLRILKAQADEIELDEIIEQYQKRFGRNPASLRDLIAAGLLRGIPVDPDGFPYVIGPDGKAQLNPGTPIPEPKP
jgi:tetratricopeptide (TPR) repeat protein